MNGGGYSQMDGRSNYTMGIVNQEQQEQGNGHINMDELKDLLGWANYTTVIYNSRLHRILS